MDQQVVQTLQHLFRILSQDPVEWEGPAPPHSAVMTEPQWEKKEYTGGRGSPVYDSSGPTLEQAYGKERRSHCVITRLAGC